MFSLTERENLGKQWREEMLSLFGGDFNVKILRDIQVEAYNSNWVYSHRAQVLKDLGCRQRWRVIFSFCDYECVCLVTQLCQTLCDPMDCSPPGSSVHGASPGKTIGVGCHALLQGIFPTQGSIPGLPHCRWILYHLSHQASLLKTRLSN